MSDTQESNPVTTETSTATATQEPPAPPATPAPAPLGEAGEKALKAERELRAAADKRARDAEAALEQARKANETETQRLVREAEERGKSASTADLRAAHLEASLAAAGITGPAATAASKLVDGLEFGADNRPLNLSDRLAAAKAAYGEQVFGGATPPAAPEPTPAPQLPDLHQGPRTPAAQQQEDAAFESAFGDMFPDVAGS
jgi:hypothetical protein